MTQLRELAEPFPSQMIDRVKKRNGPAVDTVSHFHVEQKALAVVGPHTFRLVDLIRGYIPEWVDRNGNVRMLARPNGVVGVTAELTAVIDGVTATIVEVGTVDDPRLENDAENAKKALSDAYKRCWMRLGLGLHLWAGDYYVLPKALDVREGHAADETPLPRVEPGRVVDEPEPDETPEPEPESQVSADTWSELFGLFDGHETDGTIPELEARVRKLYRLMEEVGLWPDDSLHKALRTHYNAQHWKDLGRKDKMIEFADKSFTAARHKLEHRGG